MIFLANSAFAQDLQSLRANIVNLKKQVLTEKRRYFYGDITSTAELNEIAVAEGRLLEKEITLATYKYYKSTYTNRKIDDIDQIVDSSFKCAFIFSDLGDTFTGRLKRILGWACTETNFKNGLTCHWKKGQYIKGLHTTIKYDSTDFGVWQINDVNDFPLILKLQYLYESGIINFKIIKIKKKEDLFDIPTNCAFRCLVETERRSMRLNWKQDKSKKYLRIINDVIDDLKAQSLYDDATVEKHYYRAPVKHCFMETIIPN